MSASYSLDGNERRARTERRAQKLIDESVEVRRDRRDDERRDSPRVAGRFWVRDPSHGGISEVFDGDVSFQGAAFLVMHPPHGEVLEFGMWVPGAPGELRTRGRVVQRARRAGATSVHLRFEAMPVDFAIALSEHLRRRTG